MKINLNFNLTNLEGKEIEGDNNAGKLLANLLAGSSDGKSIKLWEWALKLYKGEELDLDTTDKDVIYAFIETSKQMSNLAKAQMMLAIKDAENKEENKKQKTKA